MVLFLISSLVSDNFDLFEKGCIKHIFCKVEFLGRGSFSVDNVLVLSSVGHLQLAGLSSIY